MPREVTTMVREAMARVRSAFPHVTFSADVIVGFPGETEEEFLETAEFIKDARFLHLHLFPYSKRSGTEAADMKDQVPEPIKKKRLKLLEDIQQKLRLDMMNAYVEEHKTSPVYVLVEKWENGISNGHTEHYVETDIPTEEDLNGKIVPVLLDSTDGTICRGHIQK